MTSGTCVTAKAYPGLRCRAALRPGQVIGPLMTLGKVRQALLAEGWARVRRENGESFDVEGARENLLEVSTLHMPRWPEATTSTAEA